MAGSPPLPQRARTCPVQTIIALLALSLGLRCVAVRANSSTTSLAVSTQQPSCRVSQFFCNTGQCVALDRYCDGEDDCGDKSDEPRYCSRKYFAIHCTRFSQ
ncbi:hypothetical protein B566_EDAN010193 [Ephemera danica]|nr:hypothetical protein B566_EDAN010193 [Ephemera danica]